MMIETDIMRRWAGIVESVALFALTILAIGLIVSAVKLPDVMEYLGTILGVVILLLMLPPIMVSSWE
jgi:hypothetical protein